MKVTQEPENEIRIMDDNGLILCKFYKCVGGFLVEYDKKRVKDFTMDDHLKVDAKHPMSFYSFDKER